jgi:hypothetical protein
MVAGALTNTKYSNTCFFSSGLRRVSTSSSGGNEIAILAGTVEVVEVVGVAEEIVGVVVGIVGIAGTEVVEIVGVMETEVEIVVVVAVDVDLSAGATDLVAVVEESNTEALCGIGVVGACVPCWSWAYFLPSH